MSRLLSAFALLTLLAAPAVATAAPLQLYGITGSGDSPSSLYTVDPFTGAVTLVGATGLSHFTGIDFAADGTLYGVGGPFPNKSLYTLNPATGAATLIGATGEQIPDITIGADGVIRGWTEFGGAFDDPITLDPGTGDATSTPSSLGTSNTGVASLDATHIYVKPGSSLYSVDVTDGSFTFLGGLSVGLQNMLENMDNGNLLSAQRIGGGTQFWEINPTTLVAVALGFTAGIEFSGLAYQPDVETEPAPIPEPGTLLLAASGLAFVAARRRRSARR